MSAEQSDYSSLVVDAKLTEVDLTVPTVPALSGDKIQLIAKNDPEYMETDSDAFIAAAFATEVFVQLLSNESMKLSNYRTVDNSDTIELMYSDIADLISVQNPYKFLNETIPRTKNLKDLVRENKVRYTAANTLSSQPIIPQQQQQQQQQLQQHRPTSEVIAIDLDSDS